MKLRNVTRWSTEDLRTIISAAMRERGVPSTGVRVEVRVSKRRVHGHALVGQWIQSLGRKVHRPGKRMTMWLPQPESCLDVPRTRIVFAQVVEHEVAHLAGLDHAHMSERLYHCQQVSSWLRELPMRNAEPRTAEQIEQARAQTAEARRSKNLTQAERMVAQWERRVKTAQSHLARWKRKLAARQRATSQTPQVTKLAAGTGEPT